MFKILLLGVFMFSGCSYFKINVAMCEQLASDPNAAMPQECRNYIEEKAVKAYFRSRDKNKVGNEDLEFHKEK